MNVSAIIVTRGDVDLDDVVAAIPEEWESLIWDNGRKEIRRRLEGTLGYVVDNVQNLAVYGRYAAIQYATHDLIFVQDDDVLHTPEGIREIVDQWYESEAINQMEHVENPLDFVVANMPQNFRHRFYEQHSLVGFGAAFHRDAPGRAFGRFANGLGSVDEIVDFAVGEGDFFRRTCDIVFTALTPRVLVDVLYEDMPWASAENRMWKQPTHREERGKMLDLVLKVRDA